MPFFKNRHNKLKNKGNQLKNFRLNKFPLRKDNLKDKQIIEKRPLHKGIFLIPNAFTTAALFCGFYAIVMAMNDNFSNAAIAIFAAMILDVTDGRVARLTNTQSEFGAQYDSLSDMVCFGAAPALIIYEWSLRNMGKLGWLAAFVYCAGAALRLARFNTNSGKVNKNFFQGIPSPAAGALVSGYIWFMDDSNKYGYDFLWLSWCITVYAGITMVTNIPYYSFKDINFKKSVPFITVFLVVLIFVAISSDPPKVLFFLSLIYGLSGYVVFFWYWLKGKSVSIIETKNENENENEDKSL